MKTRAKTYNKTCLNCKSKFTRRDDETNQNFGVRKTCTPKCRYENLAKVRLKSSKPLIEQIDNKTQKSKNKNGCWNWTGVMSSTSKPIINTNRHNNVSIREFYYKKANEGKVPALQRLPSCGNSKCVNPAHMLLYAGSDAAKEDYINRLRNGDYCNHSSLTPTKVLKIRSMHEKGHSQVSLAKKFGVSGSSISHIISRRRWNFI